MGRLSEQQKNEIRERYNNSCGSITYANLAEEYGVSSNTIARIMNPQYYEKERERNRLRMQDYRTNSEPTSKVYSPLHCHIEKDADIIAKLDSVENRNGYIKDLIRKDISGKSSSRPKSNK